MCATLISTAAAQSGAIKPTELSTQEYSNLKAFIENNANATPRGNEEFWNSGGATGYVRFRKKYSASGDDPNDDCGPCSDPCRSISMNMNNSRGAGRLTGEVCLSSAGTWQLNQLKMRDWQESQRTAERPPSLEGPVGRPGNPSPSDAEDTLTPTQPEAGTVQPQPRIQPPPQRQPQPEPEPIQRSPFEIDQYEVADILREQLQSIGYSALIYGSMDGALEAFCGDISLAEDDITASMLVSRLSQATNQTKTTTCPEDRSGEKTFGACAPVRVTQ